MRPIRAWLLYLFAVFFLGALVAPWLFYAVQSLGFHFHIFQALAKHPFHRYVDRSLLIVALVGLFPFLRGIGVTSWKGVGLVRPGGQFRNLGEGFGWGFASMAAVACIAFSAGARTWKDNLTFSHGLEVFGSAVLSAVVVALLEELLFRGALQGSLHRVHPWPVALLLSSGFYALVHFFQRPQSPSDIHWFSGFVVLGRMVLGFVDPELLIPGFLTLLVAGAILGLAFLRTGTLYQSMGLHAGWIFWLKFYGGIAVETEQARAHRALWGTGKLFDGWLAFIILLPVLMVFWRNHCRYDEPSLHTGSEKLA